MFPLVFTSYELFSIELLNEFSNLVSCLHVTLFPKHFTNIKQVLVSLKVDFQQAKLAHIASINLNFQLFEFHSNSNNQHFQMLSTNQSGAQGYPLIKSSPKTLPKNPSFLSIFNSGFYKKKQKSSINKKKQNLRRKAGCEAHLQPHEQAQPS